MTNPTSTLSMEPPTHREAARLLLWHLRNDPAGISDLFADLDRHGASVADLDAVSELAQVALTVAGGHPCPLLDHRALSLLSAALGTQPNASRSAVCWLLAWQALIDTDSAIDRPAGIVDDDYAAAAETLQLHAIALAERERMRHELADLLRTHHRPGESVDQVLERMHASDRRLADYLIGALPQVALVTTHRRPQAPPPHPDSPQGPASPTAPPEDPHAGDDNASGPAAA